MYKTLFIILIFPLTLYSQKDTLSKYKNFNKFNVSVCSGYSDISGFLGVEIVKKNWEINIGWSKKNYTLDNYTESRSVWGFGITRYILIFTKRSTIPYLSIGYSINGGCENFNGDVRWEDKISFIVGYVFSSAELPISIKIGFGYQESVNVSPLAMEIKFIYKIFDF